MTIAWPRFWTHPAVRERAAELGLTRQELADRARSEANGSAVWATWTQPIADDASASLQADVETALAFDFETSQ